MSISLSTAGLPPTIYMSLALAVHLSLALIVCIIPSQYLSLSAYPPTPHNLVGMTVAGFYTSSLVRAVEPRLYPELPDVEMMMKFLAFVQHSLGHLDHTALSSAATDGRVQTNHMHLSSRMIVLQVIIVFEDPVSGFIDFLKTGDRALCVMSVST